MSKHPLILLIEDDQAVRTLVRKYLERDDFQVIEAATGVEALAQLRNHRPHLLILDIMLPKLDGFELARLIRSSDHASEPPTHNIPIIMLTARGDEVDRLYGFNLGIDDYVAKPFSPIELVARVKAVLRRSSDAGSDVGQQIQYGNLYIDSRSRFVRIEDKPVTLTAREFNLLWFLVRHPHQVFTRTQLIEQIWGHDFPGDETTVTVHIQRLRDKLERAPDSPCYIQTIRGVGYQFGTGEHL